MTTPDVTAWVETVRALYERVEMDESVGICLSSRVEALNFPDALDSLTSHIEAVEATLAKIEEDAPPTPEEWHTLNDRAEAAERERDEALHAEEVAEQYWEKAEARVVELERDLAAALEGLDNVDADYRRDTAIMDARWKSALDRESVVEREQDATFRRAEAAEARVQELEAAVLYLAGYDVAGWDGHMRQDEVLAKVGLQQ